MTRYVAVIGKSKTNRIMSVGAATEDEARVEINRQLRQNPQRREIWQQWRADGGHIVADSPTPTFDEGQANALIRGRLRELLAELDLRATRGVPYSESAAVVQAIGRARDALKAYDQEVVA